MLRFRISTITLILMVMFFSHGLKAAEADLINALIAIRNHINGNSSLTDPQIAAHKATIDANVEHFDDSTGSIRAAFSLVSTYDTQVGPLWVQGSPVEELFRDEALDSDVEWVIWNVMQNIMDVIYQDGNITSYEGILDGFEFGSAAHFPGDVNPPVTPSTHSVTMRGDYRVTTGWRIFQEDLPARRPTGTYLAPGSIVTVTVPASIVGKGYQIRVGAHSWDFYRSSPPGPHNTLRRLDRVSSTYTIDNTTMKIASPLGGSIYIDVPYGANDGLFSVDITGAVRSPFFSNKPHHQTTNSEWQNTERHHPGPWTDFESESFMMTIPTDWIYALDDAEALMNAWDSAIDYNDDMMGVPRHRGSFARPTMYIHVDLSFRGNAYYPGWPTGNFTYDPNIDYGGFADNHFTNGPEFVRSYLFHELGHGYLFPKLSDAGGRAYSEVEAIVNFAHVAIKTQAFGWDLDRAFADSRDLADNPHRTLDNTAITWMTAFNFSPNEAPMTRYEKQYQLQGYAKFVDIVKLFGWSAINQYYKNLVNDFDAAHPHVDGYQHQIGNNKGFFTKDEHLLALSKAIGADVTPLFMFWGIYPESPTQLAIDMAAEGLGPSNEIFDRIIEYRGMVPKDNAEFRLFTTKWWGKVPEVTGTDQHEGEHARQWDNQDIAALDLDHQGNSQTAVLPNGEMYDASSYVRIQARIDEILAEYFPGGDPIPDNTAPTPDPITWKTVPTPSQNAPLNLLSSGTLAADHPLTRSPWQNNQSYRLAFVSQGLRDALSFDLDDYDKFLQLEARESSLNLSGTRWRVIGSNDVVDARDHTETNYEEDGDGSPIYLVDGSTLIASGNSELWNNAIDAALDLDQDGNTVNGSVATGTAATGLARDRHLGGNGNPRIVGYGNVGSANEQWVSASDGQAVGDYRYYAISDPIPIDYHVTMEATEAVDESGVEYYFEETSGNPGGDDSGWQASPVYRDGGLTPGLTYTYRVRVRDLSLNQNESGVSSSRSVVAGQDVKLPEVIVINDDDHNNIIEDTENITYTVIFTEAIAAGTVGANDFEVFGTAGGSIVSVNATTDADAFTVVVTPNSAGSMQLRVKQWASIQDLAGNPLDSTVSIPDDDTISVIASVPDLLDITDDSVSSNIYDNDTVTFTLSFDEAVDSFSINTTDFDIIGSAGGTISSVNTTADPAVFTVSTTPITGGTFRFVIKAGATIADLDGNPMDTSSVIQDDVEFNVTVFDTTAPNPNPMTWSVEPKQLAYLPSNILTAGTLGGNNPATGNPWRDSDTYRLVFVSSGQRDATSHDIADYNAFVQAAANASSLGLDALSWKVVGSTAAIDAKDNTSTNPMVNGAGEAIFLVDGETVIANDYNDLWDGYIIAPISTDENGNAGLAEDVASGSTSGGLKHGRPLGGDGGSPDKIEFGETISVDNKWIDVYNGLTTDSYYFYALSEPIAFSNSVTMMATIASDSAGVEYYFTETSGNPGGDDSGWQESPVYVDSGLSKGVTYTYTVKARDKSGNYNETDPSVAVSVVAGADDIPPAIDSISDNVAGTEIWESDTVQYTLTFNDAINAATINLDDFEMVGSVSGTIDSVSATGSPSVFTIVASPGGPGDMRFQIKLGATIEDDAGNVFNSVSAISDDKLITVHAGNRPQIQIEGGADSWNDAAKWDSNLVPSGALDVSIGSSVAAEVDNASTPSWDGTLTMQDGSSLRIASVVGSEKAVHGADNIIMTNATIIAEYHETLSFGAMAVSGTATFTSATTSAHSKTRAFNGMISGSGQLVIDSSNKQLYEFNASNSITGGIDLSAPQRHEVFLNAAGAAGVGAVTVDPSSGDGNSAVIILNATGALANVTTLTLNGSGWNNTKNGTHKNTNYRIVMNADDSVASLIVDDIQLTDGRYSRIGLGAGHNEVAWISGDSVLTVGASSSAYGTWADSFATLSDTSASIDADNGGISTGVEWVLGGDPADSSDDKAIAPEWGTLSGDYIFTYRRTDEAYADANTTITVEYSDDMQTWSTATHGGLISITEANDDFGVGVDKVSVRFQPAVVGGQTLYVRLRVEVSD